MIKIDDDESNGYAGEHEVHANQNEQEEELKDEEKSDTANHCFLENDHSQWSIL